nr:hypothetical protein [Gordonia sp. 'Campus']
MTSPGTVHPRQTPLSRRARHLSFDLAHGSSDRFVVTDEGFAEPPGALGDLGCEHLPDSGDDAIDIEVARGGGHRHRATDPQACQLCTPERLVRAVPADHRRSSGAECRSGGAGPAVVHDHRTPGEHGAVIDMCLDPEVVGSCGAIGRGWHIVPAGTDQHPPTEPPSDFGERGECVFRPA